MNPCEDLHIIKWPVRARALTWQKSGTETTTNSDERAWGLDASSACGAFEIGWGRTEARKDPREHTATREPRVPCSAARATQPSSVNTKPRTLRASCMGRRMLWRPRCVGNPMCTPPIARESSRGEGKTSRKINREVSSA